MGLLDNQDEFQVEPVLFQQDEVSESKEDYFALCLIEEID